MLVATQRVASTKPAMVHGDARSSAKTNESLPEIALDKISHSDVYQWTRKVLDRYKVPVCFLALESGEGMYLKGRHGIDTQFASFPCMCRHEEMRELPIIVCDARQHFQYRFDPFVDGPPYARFYVGAPVMLPGSGNRCIGTFCIMDTKPRDYFSLQQCEFLVECSKWIALHLARKVQSLLCFTSDSLEPFSAQQNSLDSIDRLTSSSVVKARTKDSLISFEEHEEGSVDGDAASIIWLSEAACNDLQGQSNGGQAPEDSVEAP